MFNLIQEAREMLEDRSKEEADLIYHVAKLEPELIAAIKLAYEFYIKEDKS